MASALPTPDTLAKAAALTVFDAEGERVSFASIIRDQKTIVVFIRHFFCGSCQQYVMQLASVRQQALDEANTRLVVIGCGEWKMLHNYREITDFKGSLYADPSRALYTTFGMVENLKTTPAGQERRSYLGRSLFKSTLKSIQSGPLKTPQFIGKQGNLSQNGGEFIFGPGGTCTYATRMSHTEDHVEVDELTKQAGVVYP